MIKLKNVSKYYYSKGMISSGISKVNLEFNIGEFVVITGESGSGKSTLLNVISGLDSYEEGEMYINGVETSHYGENDFEEYRKKYIGNIFQDFNLINSYTVYQNIELILMIKGCKSAEIRKKVPEIIEQVGLTSHIKTKVSKLSGGQKQRVAIARALAKDTDIIVADEPTGNLDSESADGIVKLLSEISRNKLVIVVTHNFGQFKQYATRTIKMHDGKVAEDKTEQLQRIAAMTSSISGSDDVAMTSSISGSDDAAMTSSISGSDDTTSKKGITASGKLKLGIRNTFNILPKFLLLLVVFMFIVFGVVSQYMAFQHQKEEESKLGYNDYFYNYSEDRIVLKKIDGSSFTEDDYKAIKNVANVKSVVLDDIMLDYSMYIEDGEFSYETYPKVVGSFDGKLKAGRMPEAKNEAILTAYKDEYYFNEKTIEGYLDKVYNIGLGEDKEVAIKVVGCAYKPQTDEYDAMMYAGDLYITDEMMATMREETYNYHSKVSVVMKDREEEYVPGNPYFRIVPNSKVKGGEALVFEEVDNYYGQKGAKNQRLTVKAENIFFKDSINLTICDTYNNKTFKDKTGIEDYDIHGGTIYINQKDYDRLFKKENYQATVYVKDMKLIEDTKAALNNMGYTTLALKDTLVNYFEDIAGIIRVPIAIIATIAIFFIAYFVIRLILKSRAVYFTILRMLGMAKGKIRRILDVEMILTVNIAYGIFLAVIAAVKLCNLRLDYIINLIRYMEVSDYVILYLIILVMGYLISGKFARHLFKKTAMNTFREGDK